MRGYQPVDFSPKSIDRLRTGGRPGWATPGLPAIVPITDRTTPPLRVLTMINSFDAGGVERVALRLNAGWRDAGAIAHVVVGRAQGVNSHIADGVDIEEVPGASRSGGLLRMVRMLWHLPAIVRRRRPDFIFCAGNTYALHAVALKLMMGDACPPIVAKISNDLARQDMSIWIRRLYHRWLRIQGRHIDHFVAPAPAMVAQIKALIGVDDDRVHMIHNPVLRGTELTDYARLKHVPALRGRRFLAIGRLMPQKNFALLINAFSRIARPDDQLTILGDGPERAALTEQIVALGLERQISMPGHVSDVRGWLSQSDVFVMSSDYEGVPAVVIEAIAARLSIVTTCATESMADLIGDGEYGQMVPTGDVEALAKAMDSAPLGQTLSAGAIDHARSYTIESGASAYLRLAEGIIGATRQKASVLV